MNLSVKGTDPKALLQDLKSNRRAQVSLVALVVLVWYLWPTAPAPRKGSPARRAAVPLGDRQRTELQKLPDLTRLEKAGELPTETRLYRDLFLFDGPPPPPPPPPKPPPPPPPPTPEELAARKLAEDRAREAGTKPADLRYLGYLGSARAGRMGAFMKGEEPLSIKQGDLVNPKWRLVKVTDASAEFQNLAFPDLKHRIDALDVKGAAGRTPSNEF